MNPPPPASPSPRAARRRGLSAALLLLLLCGGPPLATDARGEEAAAPAAAEESGASSPTEGAPGAALPMRGLRFGPRPQTPPDSPADPDRPDAATGAQDLPGAPPSAREGSLPEGALRIGRARGRSKLPPELAEIAQEGTLAASELRWEDARAAFLKLVAAAPDNALAYANLGVAEHQLGNLLAASGNLKKSLELDPFIARHWQTLGLIHFERGELNLAISCLSRAIHEDPRDARTRLYLAAVVREYGWEEAAVTELERAVELDPALSDAHYNLAATYAEMRPPRVELARRHYFAAIDLGAEPSPEMEALLGETPRDPAAIE